MKPPGDKDFAGLYAISRVSLTWVLQISEMDCRSTAQHLPQMDRTKSTLGVLFAVIVQNA